MLSHAQAAFGVVGHRARWQLVVVVLVLALIGMGMGGWWVYENGSATGAPVASPAGVTAGVDPGAQLALPTTAPATSAAATAEVAGQAERSAPASATAAIAGLAGVTGAELWSDEGNLVAALESGASLNATARTANGLWLWVETAAGTGWVQTSEVIAYGLQQLDTALLPGAVAAAAEHAGAAVASAVQETAALTGAGEIAEAAEHETESAFTPADSAQHVSATSASLVARVATTDVRLNVRSGPSTADAVVTKADPDAEFAAIGRSAAGDWLLLQLGDDAGRTGWVAAEYVELSGDVETLPVFDADGSI